jgi:hypothetical protein
MQAPLLLGEAGCGRRAAKHPRPHTAYNELPKESAALAPAEGHMAGRRPCSKLLKLGARTGPTHTHTQCTCSWRPRSRNRRLGLGESRDCPCTHEAVMRTHTNTHAHTTAALLATHTRERRRHQQTATPPRMGRRGPTLPSEPQTHTLAALARTSRCGAGARHTPAHPFHPLLFQAPAECGY